MNLASHLFPVFIMCLLPFGALAQQPFITTWKTDNPGISCNSCITILTTGGGYNYDVDWNDDGIFDEFGLTGDVTHDFGAPGTYTIRIQGDFPRIYVALFNDQKKILSIDQWGDIAWTSMEDAFLGAENLTYNATDAPDLSNVTSMHGMFTGAKVFDGDLSNWDVSNVTDMSSLFSNAHAFNGNISTWNVSNVTNMHFMFNTALAFNGDLSNWDVSSVTNMSTMFQGARSFNGDISNWNVGNVTNMHLMFSTTQAFNRDLSGWDVSKVTTMSGMFQLASAYNQDLSNWDVTNVETMDFMLNGAGLDAINYDKTLIGWAAQSVQNDVLLGASGLEYCLSEDARNTLINTYGWDITYDSFSCLDYNPAPTAVCKNITVDADANCEGQADADAFDNGSSDPDMEPLSFSVSPEGPYSIGTTNVVLTVEDAVGKTDQCTATITVEDNEPPNPVCLHPTIHFNGEQVIMLQQADLLDALASTDNCGIVSFVSMSLDEVDCSQLGTIIPVTVSVEDPDENASSCTSNVTVGGLPCGFSSSPDGINCPDGSQAGYDPNTDTFTLTAEGCYDPSYYSNSDSHAYLGTQLCGDGEIIAQVTQVAGSGYAGIAMRENLSAGSRMLQLGIDGVSLTKRELRSNPGAVAFNHLFQTQGKNWLRLTRSGNNFTAYHSLDGINWGIVISTNISMNSCIDIGLYAENKTANGSMTATFENVQLNGVAPLSAPSPSNVDMANELEPSINVYPNPATNEAWIDLGSGYDAQTNIAVFNHLGQLVQQIPASAIEESLLKLSVQNWENGLYWIEVRARDKVVTKRLVRQE